MFARRATFVLSILSLAQSLSPPREVSQIDRTRLQTFCAKHVAQGEISLWDIQNMPTRSKFTFFPVFLNF